MTTETKHIKVVDETYLQGLKDAYAHMHTNLLLGEDSWAALEIFEAYIEEQENGGN